MMKRFLFGILAAAIFTGEAFAQVPACQPGGLPFCSAGSIYQMLGAGPSGSGGFNYYLTGSGPGQPPTWTQWLYPAQTTNTVLGNVTGGNAAPTPINVSQVLNTVGYDTLRPPVPGSILYKANDSTWQALGWGPSGWVLTANGQAQRPDWAPNAAVASVPTVLAYGAKCDGTSFSAQSGISIASGSNALVVTGAAFTVDDKNKNIVVPGAGVAGANLEGTLVAVVSSTQVTLSVTASTALTNATGRVLYYSTNDTAAFLTAGIAGYIGVPQGVCIVTAGALSWTPSNLLFGRSLSVQGAGIGVSKIVALGCSNGLSFNPGSNDVTFSLHNVTVTTTCHNAVAGSAINLQWSGAPFSHRTIPWVEISDVLLSGEDVATQGWAVGLRTVDVNLMNVSNFSFTGQGPQDGSGTQSTIKSAVGIWNDGAYVPTDHHFVNIWVSYATRCYFHNGLTEGVYFTNFTFFVCQRGVDYNPINDGSSHPLSLWANGHINAFEFGMVFTRYSDIQTQSMLVYCADGALQPCTNFYIVDNAYNIYLDHLRVLCFNNAFGCTAGIRIGANVHRAFIHMPDITSSPGATGRFDVGIWIETGACGAAAGGADNCSTTITNPRMLGIFNLATIKNDTTNTTFGRRAVLAQRLADLSVADSTETDIPFDAFAYDNASFIPGPIPQSYLTIPAYSGILRCVYKGQAEFTANATGYRELRLATSAGGNANYMPHDLRPAIGGVNIFTSFVSPIVPCQEGENLTLKVKQTSGGPLNVVGGKTYLAIEVAE